MNFKFRENISSFNLMAEREDYLQCVYSLVNELPIDYIVVDEAFSHETRWLRIIIERVEDIEAERKSAS